MKQIEKEHVIRQLGEWCTTHFCKDCPIRNSIYVKEYHNACFEALRFPEVAHAMAEEIKGQKLFNYDD